MMANPFMVGGTGRFDTRLMEVCSGRIVAKGGAEGYMALGVTGRSPGRRFARGRHRPQDLGWGRGEPQPPGPQLPRALGRFAWRSCARWATCPTRSWRRWPSSVRSRPVTNWRKLAVGEGRPAFTLKKAEQPA